jgi:hypothetical protein
MKYKEYEIAFSPARLNRYKNACGGDTRKTMLLYRHNVKLCQKYYGVLNIFEIDKFGVRTSKLQTNYQISHVSRLYREGNPVRL